MLVVPDEGLPRAVEGLGRIRRARPGGGDGREGLGERQGAVGGELAREELGRARRVLEPAARHLAAQHGKLVAPCRLQPVERLVQASARAQLRPFPLRVPRPERLAHPQVRDLVVLVVREQPDVVGIARIHPPELPRHLRLEFLYGRRLPVPAGRLEAEGRAAVTVLRARPDEQARAAVRGLPPEDHGDGRVPADVDPVAAAAGVRVPRGAGDGLVLRPDRRRMRVPLVRREEDVLEPGGGVGRDETPADPGVVGHQHRARPDSPVRLEVALRVGAAEELLEAVEVRVVAGAGDADVEAAAPHLVRDKAPRGVRPPVKRIVPPEPRALGDVAERARIGVVRVGRDQLARLVHAHDAAVSLDILGVVEADVGVRGLDRVERPLAHGRKPGRQVVRGDERVDDVRAVRTRDEPPPVVREHRVGGQPVGGVRRGQRGRRRQEGKRDERADLVFRFHVGNPQSTTSAAPVK